MQPTARWESVYPASPAASMWLEDLRWHKKMYRDSQFRWDAQDVIGILTWHTGGQTEFTTVDDLRALQAHQYAVMDQADRARNALADRVIIAQQELAGDWDSVLGSLGMSDLECEAAIWFAASAGDDARDSADVRRVLKFVPFRNPLIEAFELKQLLRMYEAAGNMLEDAICDLVSELLPTRPEAILAAAASTPGEGGLEQRVSISRAERGGPGSAGRIPQQVF